MGDVAGTVAARWSKIRYALTWQSHVLAPALAALTFVETTRVGSQVIGTAAIDRRGRVFLNPTWCGKLDDGQTRFVILHECLHAVLRHQDRAGGRDAQLWNIAADLVINDAILNLGNLNAARPSDAIFRDTHAPHMPAGMSAEEVYEYLRANATVVQASGGATAGCGVFDSAADGSAGDRLPDGATAPAGLSESEWRNVAQCVADTARASGAGAGAGALTPLLHVPPSRVRWQALVRTLAATALSQAGRDDTTWSRRSRRSPPNMVLPGTRTRAVKLAVVIDVSGSMSDDEVAACVAETRAAVDAAGVRAFLVVHDDIVQATAWLTPGKGTTEITSRIKGRGGTAFSPAYAAVVAAGGQFAAIVHFTDGYPCEPWPVAPSNCRRAVCALTPEGRTADVPGGWQTVPIEVPGRA